MAATRPRRGPPGGRPRYARLGVVAVCLLGCRAPLPGAGDSAPVPADSWTPAAPVWELDATFADVRVPLGGAGPVWLAAADALGACIGAETDAGPVLVRLTPEGALDPAFAGGVAVDGLVGLSGVSQRDDGGCLAAGSDGAGVAAARALLPDGRPDPASPANLPGNVVPLDAAAAPGGAMTVVGFEHVSSHVLRLRSDGTPDPAWGADGDLDLAGSGQVGVVAGFADGGVVVADVASVGRLDPQGAPDPSFGDAGWVALDLPFAALAVSRLATVSDGSVWVLAEELGADALPVRSYRARLTASGAAALSPAALPLGAGDRILALAPPFAVGMRSAGGCTVPAVWRLAEEGQGFDPDFGAGGVMDLPARSCDARATAAHLDGAGRLLVAGWDDGIAVVRLAAQGGQTE